MAFVWSRYGRERATGYDREYEQEPPTDTEPALVPGLLAQGGTPGSLEFTATLFDLIRRGRYKADPVTTERKIWGGLRTQQVADLELSARRRRKAARRLRGAGRLGRRRARRRPAPSGCRASATGSRTTARATPSASRTSRRRSAAVSGRRWFRNDGLILAARRESLCSARSAGCSLYAGIELVQRGRADVEERRR